MPGPLSGLRILEIAGMGPGPFCAMMLADMRADVLRVLRPAAGAGATPANPVVGRGMRSVAIDLKSSAGRDAVLQLAERSDALIEGFRPGVMERLGVGPDECLARNPRLIYGRMTGWGQTGPLARQAGHDIDYIALSGALAMASAIFRFVQGRQIAMKSLLETRELLEPFLARCAAERRTDAQMQELRLLHQHLVDSAHDFNEFTHANVQWHQAIAEASGNELLSTLLSSISNAVHLATRVEEYNTPATRRQVIEIHARVTDAIEAQNAEAAEQAMTKHMVATRKATVSDTKFPLT